MASNKRFLSLTMNNIVNYSIDDLLIMIDSDLKDAGQLSLDYAYSISLSVLKKLFLLKEKDYHKFYQIITSKEIINNKYIYRSLSKNGFISLRDFFNIIKDDNLDDLINYIFKNNCKLFNEMIFNGTYNLNNIFSLEIVNRFTKESYLNILNYLLKGKDKKRVVKALLRNKNNKYIYVISKMDDMVLSCTNDDSNYFDAVLHLLTYRDYRHLICDYYDKYVKNSKNEEILNSVKYSKIEVDELGYLLNYTFKLMNDFYYGNDSFEIISKFDNMIEFSNSSRDMIHQAIFGVEGYKKLKNGTFDTLLDYPKVDNEKSLLNLKIAFFSTMYGLTYDQVSKLVNSFDKFMEEYECSKNDDDIYETMVAIKNLYYLTLDKLEEIDLYREVYYKYVMKKGIYAPIEIEAMAIMEELMRKMYNNAIELV